jgi:hypothetical protein
VHLSAGPSKKHPPTSFIWGQQVEFKNTTQNKTKKTDVENILQNNEKNSMSFLCMGSSKTPKILHKISHKKKHPPASVGGFSFFSAPLKCKKKMTKLTHICHSPRNKVFTYFPPPPPLIFLSCFGRFVTRGVKSLVLVQLFSLQA